MQLTFIDTSGVFSWCGRIIYEQIYDNISRKVKELTDTKTLAARAVRTSTLTFWSYVTTQRKISLTIAVIALLTGCLTVSLIVTTGLSVHMYYMYKKEKDQWERETGLKSINDVYFRRGFMC